jgi:hypothetical protein
MTLSEQVDAIRREMVESGQPEADLAEMASSTYRTHEFSTPDRNKTYCKTCGYTERAGNHPGQPGQRWTTDELGEQFETLGFAAPFVVVVRKSDGKRGTLEFTHSPRVYFNWQEAG